MDSKTINVAEAVSTLEQIAAQSLHRLETVLDHLHGPRPANESKAEKVPGVISALERLAHTNRQIEGAIGYIEQTLGVGRPIAMAAQNQATGSGLGSVPARY